MTDNAAHNLLDRELLTGWKVIKKLEKTDNQTGAFFSVCYLVEKDGETCFMKAFDFAKFLSISTQSQPNISIVDVMGNMITAHRYERDLSEHCKNKHVDKVSFVKVAGEEVVVGYPITIVPYLIFDLAEGDVRKTLNLSSDLDYAWRFKSLHDIAIGIKQLHTIEVTHQDLKPSNILVFNSEDKTNRESKIGDLGRSICRNIDGPYNREIYTGDWTYAPPEMMYRYSEIDWLKRVFATDCYLLGSLICFYFTGINMTAILRKHIPDAFGWETWRGRYEEIVPYLENAFPDALDEFETNISRYDLKQDLREIVTYLCNPFPEKRGHPINVSMSGSNYSMERIVSKLNYLKRKAELNIKTS